jgi:hypothetical protein
MGGGTFGAKVVMATSWPLIFSHPSLLSDPGVFLHPFAQITAKATGMAILLNRFLLYIEIDFSELLVMLS